MTLTNTTAQPSSTVGNGSTKAFSVPFPFYDTSEVRVVLLEAGDRTLQTITTHYTVTGGEGSTGTVTFVTAPTSAQTVEIWRMPAITQPTDLPVGGTFPADTVEKRLDILTQMVQWLFDQIGMLTFNAELLRLAPRVPVKVLHVDMTTADATVDLTGVEDQVGIESVAKTATGTLVILFDGDFDSTTYCVLAGGEEDASGNNFGSATITNGTRVVGGCTVETRDTGGTLRDFPHVMLVFFGKL